VLVRLDAPLRGPPSLRVRGLIERVVIDARGRTARTTKPQKSAAMITPRRTTGATPFWSSRNPNTSPRLRNPLRDAVVIVRPASARTSPKPTTQTIGRRQIWRNIQTSRMLALHMNANRFSFRPQDVVSDVMRNSVTLPSSSRVFPVAMSSSPL
jgi:hypothetical protein